MTRPVFLVPRAATTDLSAGDLVTVTGAEGHHGAVVRRLRDGEAVELVDGMGTRVSGLVSGAARGDRDSFGVEVGEVVHEPAPEPRLTVVQALAKGDRSESAVEMLTECGVDRIVPWLAERSVSVWRGERRARGVERWRAVTRAAAKQSRRAWLPEVTDLHDTAQVADLLLRAELGLVLHEHAAVRLAHVKIPQTGGVVVVVGPEGGLTESELKEFAPMGALPVRLGTSILRTSTAGVAAAAVVLADSGRWD